MLLVLTLLGFLLILLLGLASYTRVENAIAGNTQREAQARQHALVALDVALAQLQKFAGPDQRVTATGESIGGANAHYTGVWSSDPAAATSTTPLTWLVSGSETPAASPASSVQLVGPQTAGTNNVAAFVTAPLVNLKTYGLPGQFANDTPNTGGTTIGRYAWWIGDQGVKAPVAIGDSTAAVNYAPWDSAELNSRLRQQISLGAGAADASGNAVFEPRDTANSPLVANQKVTAYNQLAFLKNSSGTALGLAPLKTYFHAWSPNNFNVLANTKLGGLRQDLSIDPTLLGAAFAAWVNYDPANGGYMEDPTSPISPAPLQPYSSTNALRRRYVMQPMTSAYAIAPVLSFFGLSFSFRNDASGTGLEIASRCVVGLWNPYSSALVPQDLELVITAGLPDVLVKDQAGNAPLVQLQPLLGAGSGLKFLLPFTANSTSDDRSSWLPGRVYNWSAPSNNGGTGSAGNPMNFCVRDSTPGKGSGVIWPTGLPALVPSPASAKVFRQCFISSSTVLTLELRRSSDGAKLAALKSPPFAAIISGTNQIETDGKGIDFAFLFRLPDAIEIPTGESATWLQAPARDPRESPFPTSGYVVPGGNGNFAEQFGGPTKFQFDSSYPNLLLDRDPTTGTSYNEDVPLFELPRLPLLSVGSLQHLRISGARPFTVGNSWTSGVQLNGIKVDEFFDRFYFSGVAAGVTPAVVNGALSLPNPLVKPLPRNSATGAAVTRADLQGAPNSQTSKFLLQGGAFNLNSVNPLAWAAVLRAVRFGNGIDFNYLATDPATGTADDSTTTAAGFSGAAFFRFSHSAQEVFQADDNYAQSQFGGGGPMINTPLYRRGVRTLSAGDVTALATAIVALIQQRQATRGPFLSLEEFLNPALTGNPSLLEQAILNANLNANVAVFSSQWLTQGDIMTALAPVLFPRSDTFVIRTYGEAVNPTTAATEGRAWCEAIVQRVPEYFGKDANSQPEETAPADLNDFNKTFGRRFKIVSFRWLTRSDI